MTAGSQLPANECRVGSSGSIAQVEPKVPEQCISGQAISAVSLYGPSQTGLSTRVGLPEAAHRPTKTNKKVLGDQDFSSSAGSTGQRVS